MFKRMRGERGFTLVELLVVLAILAILVAIVVPNLAGLVTGTKGTAMKQEKDVVQSAIDAYYTQDYMINSLHEIDAAITYTTLGHTDVTSAAFFTKYLRRDTKYYYSWNKHGEDLVVCGSAAGTGECYP